MKQYKFIGDGGFLDMSSSVTLKVPKSDGTKLIIENIIKDVTIVDIEDPLSIKYMDLDSKYEEVV